MEKISVLEKCMKFFCLSYLLMFATSCNGVDNGKKLIDEKTIFGEWIIDENPTTIDRLDECIFKESFKYVCYSYPPKDSASDITFDFRGRFKIVNNTLLLYHERDEVLNLDERLMQGLKIINLNSHKLVLMSKDKKLVYKRKRA